MRMMNRGLSSSDDDGDVRNVYISLLKCTETYSHLLNILCIPKCNFFLRIPQAEVMKWLWRQHYKVPNDLQEALLGDIEGSTGRRGQQGVPLVVAGVVAGTSGVQVISAHIHVPPAQYVSEKGRDKHSDSDSEGRGHSSHN